MEEKLIRYLDLIKYLELKNNDISGTLDKLLTNTSGALPDNMQKELTNYYRDPDFRNLIKKRPSNPKSYATFCFSVFTILFNKLGLEICYVNPEYFEKKSLSEIEYNRQSYLQDKRVNDHCAFILKNACTHLIFSFGDEDSSKLQELSTHIYTLDQNKYENIHIIILKNSEELDQARHLKMATIYRRSFFTTFDKICERAKEDDLSAYEKIFSPEWDFGRSQHTTQNIAHQQKIEIIDNVQVGNDDSRLYKLSFRAENSIDILPGQFIMIDTLKERQDVNLKSTKPKVHNSVSEVSPGPLNDLNIKRLSYLKRPFGIYRTYYENFTYDCSSKLNLDTKLASILYTVKPNKFEILYKVLPNGAGTNELTRLVKGDRVEILAPLGKIFDLRELLKDKIDEVHIVGGGVGVAPLVYMVQVLRYFNIKVKAFIGIENYSSLDYVDASIDPESFTATGKNAKIYVDDLKFLGLSESTDIYMSFLSNVEEEKTIEVKNVFKGSFITEPYAEYVKKHSSLNILTFTCGPLPMMHKVHNITVQHNIKSYVLMEKRMACGIGVCFSCVCKTIANGENHYSRVCIEGPIIDSKQINWDE